MIVPATHSLFQCKPTQGSFVTCEGKSKAMLIHMLEECFANPWTGVPTRCTAVSSNDRSFDTKAAQKNELTGEYSSIQMTASQFLS